MSEQQIPLPKLNYDDFYKFVISLGIPTILLYSTVATYVFLQKNWLLFSIHLLVASVAAAFVIWALTKWYARQKLMDEALHIKLRLDKLAVKQKADEAKRKKLVFWGIK